MYLSMYTDAHTFCRLPTRNPVRDKWIASIKVVVGDENWVPHINKLHCVQSEHFDTSCFTVTALRCNQDGSKASFMRL